MRTKDGVILSFGYTMQGVEAVRWLVTYLTNNHYDSKVEFREDKIYVTVSKEGYQGLVDSLRVVIDHLLDGIK